MNERMPLPEEILPPDDSENAPEEEATSDFDSEHPLGDGEKAGDNESGFEQIEKGESLKAHEDTIIELYEKRDAEKESLRNCEKLVNEIDSVKTAAFGSSIGAAVFAIAGIPVASLGLLGLTAVYSIFKIESFTKKQTKIAEEIEENIKKLNKQITEKKEEPSAETSFVEEKD